MRVFVLCTERSGSHTLAAACSHITNYTSGHETRNNRIDGRLDYPDGHIEVDNRLAWFLGSLDARYGDEAVYVHLTRDPEQVAESCTHRFYLGAGLMHGWSAGIIRRKEPPEPEDRMRYARLFVDTITANIELFLKDKSRVVRIRTGRAHEAFDELWDLIGAEGDRAAAHAELDVIHNRRKRPRKKRKKKRKGRTP